MSLCRLLCVAIVLEVSCGLLASPAGSQPIYRVKLGDTLSGIAQAHGTTVAALERLNRLGPTSLLLAGSTIKLAEPKPVTSRYVVRVGDTLSGIAQRAHTTAAAVAKASGVDVTRPILIGETLRVPLVRNPVARGAVTGGPGSNVPVTSYRVRYGDTLSAIALRRGVSLGVVAELNHLDLRAPLLAGARLLLPQETIQSTAGSGATVRGSIARWANHYGVDPHLSTALAWMESGFNNELVSNAGAVGVMQVTPDTWDYVEEVLLLGRSVPHTPDGNVRVGVAYLHHLLRLFGGNERKALAAYYQGARSLQVEGFLPGTDLYVEDILALKKRF
jgi:LysM repeat protein